MQSVNLGLHAKEMLEQQHRNNCYNLISSVI